MTRRPAAGAVLLLVLAAPFAAAAAQDQQTFTLGPRGDTPLEQRLIIDSDATPAARRPGGFGWISIEAFNPDTSAHEVLLEVNEMRGDPLALRRIRLEPGERSRVSLPLPCAEWLTQLAVEVDGGMRATTRVGNLSAGRTSGKPSFLALTDDAALGSQIRTSIESWVPEMVESGTLIGLAVKRVRDLPDRWQMLSGFDAIVLDLRSDGLSAERQQVLADYAAAGGRVVLASSAGAGPLSTDGPLAAMFAATPGAPAAALGPGARGRHGFGEWIVALPDERAFGSDVFEWLKEPEVAGMGRGFSGLPRDGLGSHLAIPGVGEVPKSMFLLLIIIFVAVIVSVTFRSVRQRRHGRLLLFVPGTGVAFTGALLVYGFFSEGLGIQGVVRSFTLLDQRSHQAVGVAQRTLYAGLQPDELPLDAGTLLVSWDQSLGDSDERQHHLRLDTTSAWVAGGEALPARLLTNLATVTVSHPRERLRLRRAGPERLELVTDPGLRLTGQPGALLVRDFQAEWWLSRGDGSLSAISAGEASTRRAEALQGFREFKRSESGGDVHDSRRPYVLHGSEDPDADNKNPGSAFAQHALLDWLATLVLEDTQPGTYVAHVLDDPCVDDLGLEVSWVAREHIVLGRLAPEDLLD